MLAGAVVVLAMSIGLRATPFTQQAGQQAKTPPPSSTKQAQDEEAFAILAEETIEKTCTACHPWETITATRRTLREWNEVVTTMAQLGAQGTEKQFTIVRKYLTRYYGAVNVNSAPAEEISAVLGLSAKDAAAIVEYRKKHGTFADAAALAKVEGIERSKIQEQPDALRFK